MSADVRTSMAKTRALMTETERDRIAGREDVDDIKRYQAISRVRNRIEDELTQDIAVLEEHHEGLLEEIREVVCAGLSETASEVTEADVRHDEGTPEPREGGTSVSPQLESETEREPTSETLTDDMMLVPGLDLPGSGSKLDARQEAVRQALKYVKEHGEAKPSELKEEVYPEYDGSYASARSWWKNCVYHAFVELADDHGVLEKADTSGVWTYTGDDP